MKNIITFIILAISINSFSQKDSYKENLNLNYCYLIWQSNEEITKCDIKININLKDMYIKHNLGNIDNDLKILSFSYDENGDLTIKCENKTFFIDYTKTVMLIENPINDNINVKWVKFSK